MKLTENYQNFFLKALKMHTLNYKIINKRNLLIFLMFLDFKEFLNSFFINFLIKNKVISFSFFESKKLIFCMKSQIQSPTRYFLESTINNDSN